jgi:hypothetical protein
MATSSENSHDGLTELVELIEREAQMNVSEDLLQKIAGLLLL